MTEIGLCLMSTGKFAEARQRYERALDAKQQGDIQGRVDHESLGSTMHELAVCLSSIGGLRAAASSYERAVEAKKQGDVHGRVDRASLASSLREGASLLRRLSRKEQAKAWERQASRLGY